MSGLLRNAFGRFEKGNSGYWLGKHLPEEMKLKHSKAMKGRKASKELRTKLSESMKNRYKNGWINPMTGKVNEKHPRWKGNDIGYHGLHTWLSYKKGRPEICQHCGREDNLQWASIDSKYSRDLDEWLSLCISCHIRYDKLCV